jgi:hypothetical protein
MRKQSIQHFLIIIDEMNKHTYFIKINSSTLKVIIEILYNTNERRKGGDK